MVKCFPKIGNLKNQKGIFYIEKIKIILPQN